MTASKQLLAATAALVGVRTGLALLRIGPENVADEIGYLSNARLLAGGVPGQMVWAPFYHGGYSLLIAPLIRLGFGPVLTYRLILAMNAVLAASLLPLLYLLLTRSFALPARAAFWVALAAAAYPSVTVWSQMAMPENLLAPLTVVWLLLFGALLRTRGQVQRHAAQRVLQHGVQRIAVLQIIVRTVQVVIDIEGLKVGTGHQRIAAAHEIRADFNQAGVGVGHTE